MEEFELKDFREGFGFGDEGIKIKKNKFGGYNKNDVDEAVKQLNKNCAAMQKAFEEKNKTFAEGIARANQEARYLENIAGELKAALKARERELADLQDETERLKKNVSDLENKLDEVKHIRNDETIINENLCLQNQISCNQKEIEELRVLLNEKDETIIHYKQEIEMIKNKAQSDLNIAYRTWGFRMEKIKNMISDFGDISSEIDKFIHNKLEAIACANDK